jgi:predicted translin family RNA/ssDNA-binding protein
MLNSNDFEEMRNEIGKFDEQRELLIKDSRNVIKLSKQIIYGIHRGENVDKLIESIKAELANLTKLTKVHPELYYSPTYKMAVQEFVEALAYYHFVKENKLPTHNELEVDSEGYLLGICDLTGELVRKAIDSAIKGNTEMALKIKEIVSEIYGEFLKFDFRNGLLRKKFDGIKYDLKKLEDLAFNLKYKR